MHADIGIGILASLLVAYIFDMPLSVIFLIAGILFALLPDIDMLVFTSKYFQKLFKAHRAWTHYPLLYIPIVIGMSVSFGIHWALLFTLCIYIHFIHDTLWIGHGIKWFAPFSQTSYKFFSQDYKIKPGEHRMYSFYGKLTFVSIIETIVFIVSIISLIVYII